MLGGGGNANFVNRTFYRGDNLGFLRGLNSESIDLIATDPPFNKGRDFHATPDSLASGAKFQDRWTWEKEHGDWLFELEIAAPALKEAIEAAYHCHSESMAAFLCFLAVRLREMRRILRSTGSLAIHCDATASHYIRTVLDAIFGRKNFRNELIWAYTGPSVVKMSFPKKHDTIFWYAKSGAAEFHPDAVRVPYKRLSTRRGQGKMGPALTPEEAASRMERGKVPESWWTDFSTVGRIASERIGYPTQKPLALYRRIIKAMTRRGDIVLDPFCGCATTCVAAEQTGRRWLGMDLWPKAGEVISDRVQRECDHFEGGEITTLIEPPARTDMGELAGSGESLAKMKSVGETKISINRAAALLELTNGGEHCQCAGCERVFDSPDYLELDHRDPRSDGGPDDLYNRIPLCKPCNGLKSNRLTLSGLQDAIVKAAKKPRDKRYKWAAASPLAERKKISRRMQ